MDSDKIRMMFDYMEYDYLTDAQHDLIISFNERFNNFGVLSGKQYDILEDIFTKAAEKVEWSR